MLKSLTKVLGGSNERALKKLHSDVEEINGWEPEFETLSDGQLRAKTEYFKSRLGEGEELDDLLPEAFAAVRVAAQRTLGQRHFDVQLIEFARRTVGAGVFVAEAGRNLEITVEPGDHQ